MKRILTRDETDWIASQKNADRAISKQQNRAEGHCSEWTLNNTKQVAKDGDSTSPCGEQKSDRIRKSTSLAEFEYCDE